MSPPVLRFLYRQADACRSPVSVTPNRVEYPPFESPASLPFHLFDDPENRWADERVAGNTRCSGCESFLVGVRVVAAHCRTDLVDRTAVVLTQKRTRQLSSDERWIIGVGYQVCVDKFRLIHVQMRSDSLDI